MRNYQKSRSNRSRCVLVFCPLYSTIVGGAIGGAVGGIGGAVLGILTMKEVKDHVKSIRITKLRKARQIKRNSAPPNL